MPPLLGYNAPMPSADLRSHSRAPVLGATLLIVGTALLVFEAFLPHFEDWLASFGSPRPYYAYGSAAMLHLVARGLWLVGIAWTAGLLIVVADSIGAGGPLVARTALRHALHRTPSFVGFVLLRGAIAVLVAIPAVLGLEIAANPALVADLPVAAGIGAPATGKVIVTAAAIALAIAAGLWARLVLVEPAALLDPAGQPVAASWARTEWGGWRWGGLAWTGPGTAWRGWIAGLGLAGLAWLPVLAEATIDTAAGPSAVRFAHPASSAPGPAAAIADLVPRLAWAPYSLFYRSAAPASAAAWALAVLRWVYLAGYCLALARLWRRSSAEPMVSAAPTSPGDEIGVA